MPKASPSSSTTLSGKLAAVLQTSALGGPTRLRAKIAALEATVKDQEEQMKKMEEDGDDIQGGSAFLSDDDDFEEDENTEEEDYEFLDAGEDDLVAIDVDEDEE
ncbi:hypothetical protein QYE76_059632 [Lolium multiflorum]|uniref:Uncharacterized protein n=1 Tax=Lolium multiflorum TaxID=4521 RepID=A0AAD8RXI4_LOLMU|nr:hypothetical protein QYE76_059632 [Lolium multiflorum]